MSDFPALPGFYKLMYLYIEPGTWHTLICSASRPLTGALQPRRSCPPCSPGSSPAPHGSTTSSSPPPRPPRRSTRAPGWRSGSWATVSTVARPSTGSIVAVWADSARATRLSAARPHLELRVQGGSRRAPEQPRGAGAYSGRELYCFGPCRRTCPVDTHCLLRLLWS